MAKKIDAQQEVLFIERLRAELNELTDDEDVIRDTIEGETDVATILETVLNEARDEAAMANAHRMISQSYANVAKKEEAKIERLTGMILRCMLAAGIDKWRGVAGELNVRLGSLSCLVENETLIPMEFLKWEPDKAKLKKELQRQTTELSGLPAIRLREIGIEEGVIGSSLWDIATLPTMTMVEAILDGRIPGAKLVRGEPTVSVTPSLKPKKDNGEKEAA